MPTRSSRKRGRILLPGPRFPKEASSDGDDVTTTTSSKCRPHVLDIAAKRSTRRLGFTTEGWITTTIPGGLPLRTGKDLVTKCKEKKFITPPKSTRRINRGRGRHNLAIAFLALPISVIVV